MKTSVIKFAQPRLYDGGFEAGQVDGDYGSRTLGAVESAMRNKSNEIHADWQEWSKKGKLVFYIQKFCKERKIETGKM